MPIWALFIAPYFIERGVLVLILDGQGEHQIILVRSGENTVHKLLWHDVKLDCEDINEKDSMLCNYHKHMSSVCWGRQPRVAGANCRGGWIVQLTKTVAHSGCSSWLRKNIWNVKKKKKLFLLCVAVWSWENCVGSDVKFVTDFSHVTEGYSLNLSEPQFPTG